ncbi:MAG: NUDIX domain-containing protein [Planctomycetes bacterium]|nr:NUDIX domain-containing protein [Planctomycetota bacterium]
MCAHELRRAPLDGVERPVCSRCGFVLYANPASASCAVVVAGRDVCLVKRKIEPYRGHWTLPAGFQEYHESPAQAAIREAREECGLEVEILTLLDVMYTTDDARKRANLNVYLCRPIGGELCAGDDAEATAFFSIDHLPDSIGFQNNQKILNDLRERASNAAALDRLVAKN